MKNKFLIVLIIIIFLFMGSLTYYKYFVWDKKTDEKKSTSEELENNNNEEPSNLLTSQEISLVTSNFPYEKLLENKDKTVSDLTNIEKFLIGVYGLNSSEYKRVIINDLCIPDDINIEKYKNAYDNQLDVKSNSILYSICVGKKLGFTNTQLLSIDNSLWEDYMSDSITGNDTFYLIEPSVINNIIEEKLGIKFSFTKSKSEYIYFYQQTNLHFISSILNQNDNGLAWIYDKNIDKIFLRSTLKINFSFQYSYIDSGEKDGDNYVIKVISGYFQAVNTEGDIQKFYLSKYATDDDYLSEALSIDISEENKKNLVELNKDKLNEYDITFKKVGDNYQFVSMDYVK